jgi:hypothetical protein
MGWPGSIFRATLSAPTAMLPATAAAIRALPSIRSVRHDHRPKWTNVHRKKMPNCSLLGFGPAYSVSYSELGLAASFATAEPPDVLG